MRTLRSVSALETSSPACNRLAIAILHSGSILCLCEGKLSPSLDECSTWLFRAVISGAGRSSLFDNG